MLRSRDIFRGVAPLAGIASLVGVVLLAIVVPLAGVAPLSGIAPLAGVDPVAFAASGGRPLQGLRGEVAIVKSRDLAHYNETIQGFLSETQAKTTEYDIKGDREVGIDIIRQIRRSKPDLILAVGAQAATLSKENLPDIPMVYTMVVSPERYQLTKGAATGISMGMPVADHLALFKRVLPLMQHLGVIYDTSHPPEWIREVREQARLLQIELIAVEVGHPRAFPLALRGLLPQVEGVWMISETQAMTPELVPFMLLATIQDRIPLMASSPAWVKLGALLSLSPNYEMIGKQSAQVADQILKSPGRFRGEILAPQTQEISINLKTARLIGVEIPKEVLSQANGVFQ